MLAIGSGTGQTCILMGISYRIIANGLPFAPLISEWSPVRKQSHRSLRRSEDLVRRIWGRLAMYWDAVDVIGRCRTRRDAGYRGITCDPGTAIEQIERIRTNANMALFDRYRTNRSPFVRKSGPAGPHSLVISSNSLTFGRFVRCRSLERSRICSCYISKQRFHWIQGAL